MSMDDVDGIVGRWARGRQDATATIAALSRSLEASGVVCGVVETGAQRRVLCGAEAHAVVLMAVREHLTEGRMFRARRSTEIEALFPPESDVEWVAVEPLQASFCDAFALVALASGSADPNELLPHVIDLADAIGTVLARDVGIVRIRTLRHDVNNSLAAVIANLELAVSLADADAGPATEDAATELQTGLQNAFKAATKVTTSMRLLSKTVARALAE